MPTAAFNKLLTLSKLHQELRRKAKKTGGSLPRGHATRKAYAQDLRDSRAKLRKAKVEVRKVGAGGVR